MAKSTKQTQLAMQKKTTPPAPGAERVGTAKWEKEKKDVPLRLLVKPSRPYRGLHLDIVQDMKELLRKHWSSSFNMTVVEGKNGSPLFEVVDGYHRFTALRELWDEGVIDGEYLVGVAIFREDTPESILLEAADTVNTSNETFQRMTLVDKLYFIRQVFMRMDEARIAETSKRIPEEYLFQEQTVWTISPAKLHEYLYKNKSDSHTQKLVGLFRAFFSPWDYQRCNVTQMPLNRVSTVYNQLMWLNERSARWWAQLRNLMWNAMESLNKRANTEDWKTHSITKVEFESDLKPINGAVNMEAWMRTFTEVLKVTGLLTLKPVYPGIFNDDEYGQFSTAVHRPKYAYILHRGLIHFASTGQLPTRVQYEQYRAECLSNEVYGRYNLWAALEVARQTLDDTVGGSLWCTAWSASFAKPTDACAWPACRKLVEELASADLQACSVCCGSTKTTYRACLDCTKMAYDNKQPLFLAGTGFEQRDITVCPTCFYTLAIRAQSTTWHVQGAEPSQLRYCWPHPENVPDTSEGTKDCIRCWVGLGQCNVHELHRGKPFYQQTADDIDMDALVPQTKERVTRIKGRSIFRLIVEKVGLTNKQAEVLDACRILHEVQLACLLPSKDVIGLWRAASTHGLVEPKLADLDHFLSLGKGGGGGGAGEANAYADLLAEDDGEVASEHTVQQAQKKEQARKLQIYKTSLHRPNACRQLLVPKPWQTFHSRRTQSEYKNQFDLVIFDPMYGALEQPTQDDFALIREMLYAMTKKNATAVLFNNMNNFDLWRKAIEQPPPDKDTAPWYCDPWPLVVLRLPQRNRMPRTADYMKNRSEFALIFRKAVRSEGGKRARWTRADGGMLLDQFARLHPEIQPANSNVWENYVPPGRHEALHDEKGVRVRPLAEKSRALCEMILARFCPCDRDKSATGKVFDFYAGTGVFAIAAKRMGIDYVGTEKDERVCQLAQMRLGAVQEILDTPELVRACGKPQAKLTTFTVYTPVLFLLLMFSFLVDARTRTGCFDELRQQD
jgi:DNA modification methylase